MKKGLSRELLPYIFLIMAIIFLSDFIPKFTIIAATPFVYTPETYNETNIKVTVFQIADKVIMRANVTNQGGNAIDKVILNLTDSNNVNKYTNEPMSNTLKTCPGTATCNVWEKNYTLQASDPKGTWIINVTANDTANAKASNSTTFTVNDTIPPKYSLNSTNSTLAGTAIKHSLNWTADLGLSGYIFSFCNGTWNGTNCLPVNLNWADSNCNYRRPLTFSQPFGTENLTNFPVLIALNSSRIDYTKINATDIRFYDADNTTLLYKETELWNESGDSFIWVKVPQVDNSATDYIWAYYNCSNSNNDDATSVWSNNYTGVWHLKEGSETKAVDSTNNNNGTLINPVGWENSIIDGGIGVSGGDGSTGHGGVTSNSGFTYNQFTVEAIIKPNVTTGNYRTILCKVYNFLFDTDTSSAVLGIWLGSGAGWDGTWAVQGSTGLQVNNRYFVAGKWNSTHATVYINGSINGGPGAKNPTINSGNTMNVTIGMRDTDANQPFSGNIDEARISNVSRSDSWINASYLTESDQFITYGSEQGWVNDTWVAMTGTGNWSNVTKVVNSTVNATIAWCVYANDTSNNWNGTSCSNPFSYSTTSSDSTPPIVTIQSPSNTTYATTSVWANVTLNEAGSWCGRSLDGGSNVTMTNSTGNWNNQMTGLSQNTHSVRLCCNDTSNNINCSVIEYFTVDTTPPGITVDNPQNTTYTSLPININLTLNESASWCGWNLDNSGSNTTMTGSGTDWDGQINSASEAAHRLYVYCNDSVGNMGVNNSVYFTYAIPYLEVNLINPPLSTSVNQYTTFNVNATVTCRGGNCGTVQGTIRYNKTSVNPDTPINTTEGATPFYIDPCNFKMKLTFDNSASSENLTNFPVLVKLNSSRIDYAKTSATDIRFYDADESTLLYKETELWNESGDSFIWVKVPQVDNSATDYIWAYYNCSNSNSDDATNVWDSNYVGVWHLHYANSTNYTMDSTSNDFDGLMKNFNNNPPSNSTGKIDNAFNFDGTNDLINVTNSSKLDLDAFTLSAWVNCTSTSDYRVIISKQTTYQDRNFWLTFETGTGKPFLRFSSSSSDTDCDAKSTTNFCDSTWHYIVGWHNGTDCAVFVDGKLNTSYDPTLGTPEGVGKSVVIGWENGQATRYFAGGIDEARISNTSRSASWINASYLTESDQFITYGSEESTKASTMSCGSLSQDQSCQLNWTVNATGAINSVWKVGVLFNSSSSSVSDNHTDNATITIIAPEPSITLWSPPIIDFASQNPSTYWNNATNNTNNFYNITIDPTSCSPIDIWIKGTYLENITMSTKIGVGNITWNNYDNYTTSINMSTNYVLINASLSTNTNVTTYYWLNVPAVYAGSYNGTATICGNCTPGGCT